MSLRKLLPALALLLAACGEDTPPPVDTTSYNIDASRIVYEACFFAGLRNYRPDLGAAWRPRKLAYAVTMTEEIDIRPSFVVDITGAWETKLQAIAAYESQWTPPPGETQKLPLDLFRERVELAGRRHGQRIGVPYGEAWVTREPLVVDDLLALEGDSGGVGLNLFGHDCIAIGFIYRLTGSL